MNRPMAMVAFAGVLWAQHQHAGMPAEKPVALYPGLGVWKHPIATRSPEAQKFFDQGLIMLYGFNLPEARRSFEKALELDPSAAMAHWGVSMATGPYVNTDGPPTPQQMKDSCQAVQAGLSIAGLSADDRAWLESAATRCPDFSDPAKYIAAMRALAARFPDDPDAQTWFAESLMVAVRWHWYNPEGKPAAGVEEAERVLEAVVRRYPNHPGANHLYVHAVESSPTPERGIPSAQRLMGIVPAAGHIVHMPGHIWLATGEYQLAVDVNERAADVDREYFAQTGMLGEYYPYYLHNLDFILYARTMQGRAAETSQAIATMEEAMGPIRQSMPEMAEVFNVFTILSRIRVQQWDSLLASPQPKTKSPLMLGFWHYSRAMAFAAQAKPHEAAVEQSAFEGLRAKLDRSAPWGNNKTGDTMDLASMVLAARLEDSIDKWRKAVALQDALIYDEPPGWYYPVRESLGAALLQSGDAAGAEQVFREGVRRSPHNGRMLFGLLESLKAQKKNEAAAWVEREFESAWKGADLKLRIGDL
jgi:tetratricopeptide (TPR) repeat protein